MTSLEENNAKYSCIQKLFLWENMETAFHFSSPNNSETWQTLHCRLIRRLMQTAFSLMPLPLRMKAYVSSVSWNKHVTFCMNVLTTYIEIFAL